MAAIIGLDRDEIDEICSSVEQGYVAPANFNCPGQIVLSGEKASVVEAVELAKEAGARRAVALAVSAPSHCKLMSPVSEKLSKLLKSIEIKKAKIPVVNNADAAFISSPDEIRDSLVRQIMKPLLWEDSIILMIKNGVDTFIELGPGKVLSGLIKRIDPDVRIYNVGDKESLRSTAEALKS